VSFSRGKSIPVIWIPAWRPVFWLWMRLGLGWVRFVEGKNEQALRIKEVR
jgi:hypothetical protein